MKYDIFLFILAAACILSILGLIFNVNILKLLHTPEGILQPASQYLGIIFMGVAFLALYNLYSSMLRGIGDSKVPMYSIIISSIVNVVLDLAFVNIFYREIRMLFLHLLSIFFHLPLG